LRAIETAVHVFQAGDAGALEWHGRELVALPRAGDLELDDLDFDVVADGVVRTHRAVYRAAVIKSTVDVLQKVRRGERRACGVDLDLDVPPARLEDDDGVGARLAGKGRGHRAGSDQQGVDKTGESRHRRSV
jgi:hypothetical protein